MAELARIEERIDRVAVGGMEVSDALGGIRFQNMVEVMEFAKCMAIADTAVPKHLRGNVGMCLAVCVQALEWRFSPFAVANKSYVVNDRIGYESQLVHAVIEQRAPITGRLKHSFTGEGDERRCIVSAVLKETGEALEYISPPFGKIQPKNSPLWKTKPDLQLYYNTSRDFCRAYFPDVLLGVYSADELRDHVGPDHAKDVTKPDVASRLKGRQGRGFDQQHVDRESRGGVIEESSATDAPRQPDRAETVGGLEKGGDHATLVGNSDQAGEKPATESSSASASLPPNQDAQPERPATTDHHAELAGQPDTSAGTPSPDAEVEGGDGGGDATPSPRLPQGWEITYAAALRRAQKKESLAKYASQFWAQYGGWPAHKNGPNGATAAAVFDAFSNNFGNREEIERLLRELI